MANNHQLRKISSSIVWRSLVASSLMLLTATYLNFGISSKDVAPLKPLSTFPTKIGQWKGQVGHFEKKVYDILGVDDSFLCNYRGKDGRVINLYIGYYKSQREGELIHSPKNCMPGAGWNIVDSSLIEIYVPGKGPQKVIKLVLTKGKERQIMLYWFQSRGRIIASEYWQKIYLVIDSITKHRTDGSFVRLISPVYKDDRETLSFMKDFAKKLFPILNKFLPGAKI